MNIPSPRSTHRDDIEPFSAAALIESTYDYPARPSRRLRAEIAPTNDPLANDPGSIPHAASDDIIREDSNRPIEDIEGILSRKGRAKRAFPSAHSSTGRKNRKPKHK